MMAVKLEKKLLRTIANRKCWVKTGSFVYLCTRNYQSPCNDCLELSYYETETNTIGGQTIPCALHFDYLSFLLWGFAHAILNVLNKHFQEILDITKTHSAFIQMTMYMGYFIMAIPAGFSSVASDTAGVWYSVCCFTASVRCSLSPGSIICLLIFSCLHCS